MAEPTDDLLAQLGRWAAEQQVSQAAAGRSRTRSLLDQLASSATWAGVLLDLAEAGTAVEVTVGAHRLPGRLVGIGQDFAALEPPSGLPVLVRFSAITSLAAPTAPPAGPQRRSLAAPQAGSRRPAVELSFVSALEALVGEAAPLRVLTAAPPIEGDAVALGEDILTLRSSHGVGRLVHLPLGAVGACELR